MEDFNEKLNTLLVEAYNTILKVEEEMIKSVDQINLSMSEMHMLESVGKHENGTISDIAADMRITLPSVTISINKLIKKGYVEKVKSKVDARVVHVRLTEEGKRIDRIHRYFHKKMTDAVIQTFTEEEKAAVYSGVLKLKSFFDQKIDQLQAEYNKEVK